MVSSAQLSILIRGRVQGVFFRDFCRNEALRLNLTGYIRNLPDGQSVEVVAEGSRINLQEFENKLRIGPPRARVITIESSWNNSTGKFQTFKINY